MAKVRKISAFNATKGRYCCIRRPLSQKRTGYWKKGEGRREKGEEDRGEKTQSRSKTPV
jgi:hypothetical protein